MNLSFLPLAESHFPLLLKWLEAPHVKKWWDQDLVYTLDLVKEKYGDYVKGYKKINGLNKTMQAYLICLDNHPIGYIQIYNVYDFRRSKPLTGLPENLGGIDVFIGEEAFLGKGLGSQVMAKFLGLYARDYSYLFVDPDVNNIAAIKAYEKAGFRKLSEQLTTQEIWMLWERPKALQTIQKLVKERYSQAKAVFWAGSVSQNKGGPSSDLDLVIVFDYLPNAYREAFIYDSWPIDAFIHDLDTLNYFFEESRIGNGISGLIDMILNGCEILESNPFSKAVKILAQGTLQLGPMAWNKERIDKERFLITDVLEDIKFSVSREEQIASIAHLFEPLIQFYFRAQNKWCASGKSLIRYLKNDNPELALEFNQCFDSLFRTGDVTSLESLVKKILAPYGGLFWDGFKSNAHKESRK